MYLCKVLSVYDGDTIAKNVLEEKILNKIVECHIIGFDKYGWILANIIYSGENINDLCVEFGHVFEHKIS